MSTEKHLKDEHFLLFFFLSPDSLNSSSYAGNDFNPPIIYVKASVSSDTFYAQFTCTGKQN